MFLEMRRRDVRSALREFCFDSTVEFAQSEIDLLACANSKALAWLESEVQAELHCDLGPLACSKLQ